ncbi:DHHW family protein [Clostridium sp. Marseille-Q2269]|uniref:DHHW family protein n=1 Tax=Clostridium sp. Marseille-Q2269 TaxID=2942205 RepID=UPI0020749889|nr:DHHW family protein [Clostridium sp. Marseille-Q2269]
MNFKKKPKVYHTLYKRLLGLLFVLFIFIVLIINAISKDKTFSVVENRNLKTKPKFSLENLINNQFTKKYEEYISDQFIFRNLWINIKSSTEKLMGKKENNDVYIGHDDYLIDKFKKPDQEDVDEKIKAVNTFVKNNSSLSNYIMIVPTKIKVLEDRLPKFAPSYDEVKYINDFYGSLDKNIKRINVFDALNKNKDKYIYYRTDHHWTTEGAYYAYLEFCKKSKIKPKFDKEYNIDKVSNSFYGSLYSRSGISDIEPDDINVYLPKQEENIIINYIEEKKKSVSLYNAEDLNTKDKYTLFTDGNHPVIKIQTSSKSNKRLLVIKDSYANSFIPFLTSHYSDILVVDLRYYANKIEDLIKDNNITDTLILYNASTFFEDESILDISEYDIN